MITYRHFQPAILFVGINPHFGSFDRGVPFSNNKTFWYLLSDAGLSKETRAELRDDEALKLMYHTKFNDVYKLGFTNIIDRPTRDITQLKKGEEVLGRERITQILEIKKPKVVCFIGRVTYEKYTGRKDFFFGWQHGMEAPRLFVMHFSPRGEGAVRIREFHEVDRGVHSDVP